MIKVLAPYARRIVKYVILAALSSLPTISVYGQGKNCALVLMHGKWGSPASLSGFARDIDPVCTVKLPEMPWSGRRLYDEPYPVALQEIDAQIKALRAQGFKRILVGGQSFGANAALAYMASIGDADGVIALAPGHAPNLTYKMGIGKAEVDKARELVTAGKGDTRLSMDDLNQGTRRIISMSATTLLSYFDPEGLGNIPGTTTHFKKPVPVLWVVGTADPLLKYGEGYGYANLPAHAKSKYWVVQAGHGNTPDLATKGTLEWLKELD